MGIVELERYIISGSEILDEFGGEIRLTELRLFVFGELMRRWAWAERQGCINTLPCEHQCGDGCCAPARIHKLHPITVGMYRIISEQDLPQRIVCGPQWEQDLRRRQEYQWQQVLFPYRYC